MYSIVNKIPVELWINIFKHLDLKTLSNILCTNKHFNKMIEPLKWDIIDLMYDKGCFIPKNRNTYTEYLYCIDWMTFVYKDINIPEDVIIELHEFIDFPVITTKQKFSEKLIRKFYDKIPTYNLLNFQKVPMDILTPFIDSKIPEILNNSYWYTIWKNQSITVDFVNKFKRYVDWNAISSNKDALSIDLINAFHNELIWYEVTLHGIHECIIENFIYKMDTFSWKNIAYFSQLSESFILKYEDKLDIFALFSSQQMSEKLILYLLEKVTDEYEIYDLWSKISLNQCLSMNFIKNNIHNLNLLYMIRNPRIKRKFLKVLYD
jgi:hypothetical protein